MNEHRGPVFSAPLTDEALARITGEATILRFAEIVSVRPQDVLCVPVPESWTPHNITQYQECLPACLAEHGIVVAAVMPMPGGYGIQALRQETSA